MLLNCGVGEHSWESLGLQEDQTNQSQRKWTLNIHWKNWCWNGTSNTLATWCEELTHWKRPWCWERLRAGGKGGSRGWFGWTASPPTQWSWVWANSGRQWRTGKPGMLRSTGSQTVRHDFSNWPIATTKRKEAVTLSPFLMVLTWSLLIAFFAASPSRRWKTKSCSLVIKTSHS